MTSNLERIQAIAASARVLEGPLLPLLPAKPLSRLLPVLPSRSPDSAPSGWTCETFILPAAFPRGFPSTTKRLNERRKRESFEIGAKVDVDLELLQMLERQTEADLNPVRLEDVEELERQEQLYSCVNRYVRKGYRSSSFSQREPGLTLVLSHANGFHKEIFEPMIEELSQFQDEQTRAIDEIWSIDCVNQGDAAVLNFETLGDTFNWSDHGRDIINFISSYLDAPLPATTSSSFPAILSPILLPDRSILTFDDSHASCNISTSFSVRPSDRRYRNRIIVGAGHSLGGGGMTFAASSAPSLFSSLILIDPVLPSAQMGQGDGSPRLASGALMRKDTWSSLDESRKAFLSKPFFQAWDERVLRAYLAFGLKSIGQGAVSLKARKIDEALVFANPGMTSGKRAFTRLPLLPSSLPVHFLFADVGRSVLPEEVLHAALAQVPHSTNSRVKAGHLLIQEAPQEAAREIMSVLRRLYPLPSGEKL